MLSNLEIALVRSYKYPHIPAWDVYYRIILAHLRNHCKAAKSKQVPIFWREYVMSNSATVPSRTIPQYFLSRCL